MTGLLFRTFPAVLEEGDGRTISGVCVPYDTPSLVQDDGMPYQEMFARGAFARDRRLRNAPHKVELKYEHGTALGDTVGIGVEFEDRDDGLFGRFRALDTEAGRQGVALVRAGVLGFLSVGFAPVDRKSRTEGGVLVRLAARLGEVSLVRQAAYDGTAVMVRRAALDAAFAPPIRDEVLDRRLVALGYGRRDGPPPSSGPPGNQQT